MDFLVDGPQDASVTVLFAHGAGAPMDSPSLDATVKAFAGRGLRVARFEFGYMAARRTGTRRPPPRAEALEPEYFAAIDALERPGRLVIGGKSMGGRVASMVAEALYDEGKIAGLLCLGYPFHPPSKPHQLRTQHLLTLTVPTLICQGTRDEFGAVEEVPGYALPQSIEILWLEDGNHDLTPRKKISGHTKSEHLDRVADRVAEWAQGLAARG
ncbi:alpha/beta hydrolase [Silicimonas algicola]|uniref:KANL3/Tex30 alpha/beta hydrolase-like domain-containing protein n=1 Tax=Silicimonas algicola TaxID=1826607 RepID=A0A316G9Q0_9RHOB|nr:alpha/beta family hydrolase [Silicimonas algicola]AZQ67940.1 alpha/beta hydrolase [Silicimonas algicola]PWK57624.1 hypothetical protein C8D95_102269 [Silicimonas algicola]